MCKRIVIVLLALLASPGVVAAGQVPCAKVVSELNKMKRSEDKLILAMEKVARKLDTSPIWVENCMRVYGRTVPSKVAIDLELREDLLEQLEEGELAPEDRAPEDLREPDEPGLPDPESSGTKKRKTDEYIKRYEYLPQ